MRTLNRFAGRGLALSAVLLVAACGNQPQETPGAASITAGRHVTLEDLQKLGLTNPNVPIDNVVTAGQPTQDQFHKLVGLGFRNFVSLRPASENGGGWEEALVMDEGVSFTRLPIDGENAFTHENVEAFARALHRAGDSGTVIYCGSGDRVGAMFALKANWIDGASPTEALELGRDAGLRRLEPAVRGLLLPVS